MGSCDLATLCSGPRLDIIKRFNNRYSLNNLTLEPTSFIKKTEKNAIEANTT
jgi:hypothetical protein